MKRLNAQILLNILFFGALWGIVEASVGYLLHFLPSLIAGTILFPFAALILSKTYHKCGSSWAILGVGIIAASIKAFDFFLPVLNVFKVINPMVSIILEALVVFAVIKVTNKAHWTYQVRALFTASFGWRLLFLGYFGVQMLSTGYAAPQIQSISAIADFVLVSGSISALIGIVLFLMDAVLANKLDFELRITPILSTLAMALAIALTLIL